MATRKDKEPLKKKVKLNLSGGINAGPKQGTGQFSGNVTIKGKRGISYNVSGGGGGYKQKGGPLLGGGSGMVGVNIPIKNTNKKTKFRK